MLLISSADPRLLVIVLYTFKIAHYSLLFDCKAKQRFRQSTTNRNRLVVWLRVPVSAVEAAEDSSGWLEVFP